MLHLHCKKKKVIKWHRSVLKNGGGGSVAVWREDVTGIKAKWFPSRVIGRKAIGLTSNQNIMMSKKCVIFPSQWKTLIFQLRFFFFFLAATSLGITLTRDSPHSPCLSLILGLQQWLWTSESALSPLILLQHRKDNEREAVPSDLHAISNEILIRCRPTFWFQREGKLCGCWALSKNATVSLCHSHRMSSWSSVRPETCSQVGMNTLPYLLILGKLVSPSFWEGQATGVAGTSLAHSQADVASVA